MGKRFEGEEPTYADLLAAYRLIGLDHLLGSEGPHTAFSFGVDCPEHMTLHVIPGDFTAAEIQELLDIVYS